VDISGFFSAQQSKAWHSTASYHSIELVAWHLQKCTLPNSWIDGVLPYIVGQLLFHVPKLDLISLA
tara:strand:- start:106 stop:303 length:198 start_codon:yes stop_codon:yes gene_type:complete